MTVANAVMVQPVAFGRAPYATTLQGRAARTANLSLQTWSAVQALAAVISLNTVLAARARVPPIDMYRMEMRAGPTQVSSVRVVSVPVGICSAESN